MSTASFLLALLREWALRIAGLVRRSRTNTDLQQELDFHIEQVELELRRKGFGEREAHRLARAQAGNADAAMERLHAQSHVPWFGTFSIDVALGFRMLRKYWGLTAVGGLAIAGAIAIVAGQFLFFDVIWQTDLPLEDGESVVAIQIWDPATTRRRETSIADAERWRDRLTLLENVGAFRTVEERLVADAGDEIVSLAEMSAAGFHLTRVQPVLGRVFTPDDEREGAAPVIVIGFDEWQRRHNGNADVIGQAIRLGDSYHTIVGVMPEGFAFPVNHELWIPLKAGREEYLPAPPRGTVFGRLRPGVALETAGSQLDTVGMLPGPGESADTESLKLSVLPYAQNFIDDLDPDEYARRPWNARLTILLMSLLLLPPSLNIAILVYARTITRQEELAVRTALGASRGRIVGQLFVEMLVLAACAAAIALIGLTLITHYVRGILLQRLLVLPFWVDVDVTWKTYLFAAILAVGVAAVAGLVPALHTTSGLRRPGLSALDNQHRARLGGFWTTLIVAQIAFSFAALPASIQISWSILRADLPDPGFPADEYMIAGLALDIDRPTDDPSIAVERANELSVAQATLFRELEADRNVAAGPALSSAAPGNGTWATIEVEGVPTTNGVSTLARRVSVDDAYFDLFDISVILGRNFTPGEFASQSAAVMVSERFVERFLGGAAPLGQRIRFVQASGNFDDEGESFTRWYEIIGVVADAPANSARGTVFQPLAPGSFQAANVTLRLAPGTVAFGDRLRQLASSTSPPLRIDQPRLMSEVLEERAFFNFLGGFFLLGGALAVLLLSAAGTYALMSFTVNEQRREIGIRLALGASRQRLLWAIFRRASRQITTGAIVGIAIATFIEVKIPAIQLIDGKLPGVFPGSIMLIAAVGLLATAGPAARALRLDPSRTLREEN